MEQFDRHNNVAFEESKLYQLCKESWKPQYLYMQIMATAFCTEHLFFFVWSYSLFKKIKRQQNTTKKKKFSEMKFEIVH